MDRREAVSGLFYPSDKKELSDMIDYYLKDIDIEKEVKHIYGLISPHAGYIYSGKVAAHGYKQLLPFKDKYQYVVVFAPSHRAYFKGFSIYNAGNYSTPLGITEIPLDIVNKIIGKLDFVNYIEEAEKNEHSCEVQVPFLQKVLNNFKLIPVIVGKISQKMIEDFVLELLDTLPFESTLFVASSDLSHFFDYKRAVDLDKKCIDYIINKDKEEYIKNLENIFSACGGIPIYILLNIMEKKNINKKKLLHYANSGDVTGDRSSVVGYCSIMFYD